LPAEKKRIDFFGRETNGQLPFSPKEFIAVKGVEAFGLRLSRICRNCPGIQRFLGEESAVRKVL
jgi:O-acetylhomoserine/O-acetylserine sulfhydrylase-like pyridoxal-dependent enzyme